VIGGVANCIPLQIHEAGWISFAGSAYLLVALIFGPVHGAAAAAIAGSVWPGGNPVIASLGILEAFAVGWLARRLTSLQAGFVFWIAGGVPVAYGLLKIHATPSEGQLWILVFTTVLNGLLNLIVADHVALFSLIRRVVGAERERPSIQALLVSGLTTLIVVPIVLLAGLNERVFEARLKFDALARLRSAAAGVRDRVDNNLLTHQRAIQSLVFAIENSRTEQPAELNRVLQNLHRQFPGFITMVAADRNGALVASNPLTRLEDREPLPKANVSDREYFQAAIRSGQPFISDAFEGRGFGSDPIVAISAPVMDSSGKPRLVVEGSLNLKLFSDLESSVKAGAARDYHNGPE
jgi:hypothetical protein